MYEEDTIENRNKIIEPMLAKLETEGIDESEIVYFKDFASKQPYDRLKRDSIIFWNMRV